MSDREGAPALISSVQTESVTAFRAWLDSEQGCGYLFRTAGAIFREAQRHGSLATVLPYNLQTSASPAEKKEIQEEIAHDFLVFILSDIVPSLDQKADLVMALVSGRVQQVIHSGWLSFLNKWRDKARDKEANPRGYLYRRVRDIVSHDARFAMQKMNERFPAFRPAPPPPGPTSFWQGHDVDFVSWPAPVMTGTRTPEKEIYSGKFLGAAALFFFRQAASDNPGAVYVTIRDFVNYLVAHFPWLNLPLRQDPLPEFDDPELGTGNVAAKQDMEERIDRMNALSSISVLAEQLVSNMPVEECVVMAMKLEQPRITFREIAERLHYPDHNRAYRLYHRAMASCRRFCENWPGPPLSELHEEVREAFMNEFLDRCKKRGISP